LDATPFTQVSAGGRNTCAMRTDGTVTCWGSNSDGQSPATRAALSGNFTDVRPHTFHTCALRNDGVVECWGNNWYDQSLPTKTAQAYTGHMYPTATFSATPNPVQVGNSFTLSLSSAQVPGWSGPVSFTYAFDCGDGNGYGVFRKSSTASCSTSAAGSRTVGGKVSDQSGDVTAYTATVVVGAASAPVLTIDANATLVKGTGQATVSGTASCSAATALTVNVDLSQAQTKGKTTTTVTGTATAKISCSGTTAWSALVTASSPAGSKFVAGVATAAAGASGATATRAVQVK
jgi:hypothetical protein